jgi:hypothetical protein
LEELDGKATIAFGRKSRKRTGEDGKVKKRKTRKLKAK